MPEPIEVNGENWQSNVMDSDLPVMVDFWAEWCGPCKMIAPAVHDLALEYEGKLNAKKGDYFTDKLTDAAIDFIDRNKDKPFFVHLEHFAVHDPIQGRKDLVEKYEKKLASMPKHTVLWLTITISKTNMKFVAAGYIVILLVLCTTQNTYFPFK